MCLALNRRSVSEREKNSHAVHIPQFAFAFLAKSPISVKIYRFSENLPRCQALSAVCLSRITWRDIDTLPIWACFAQEPHLFDRENEKLLAENDAPSQAASAYQTKRYASENNLFPLFALWAVPRKTSNTGAEKLWIFPRDAQRAGI